MATLGVPYKLLYISRNYTVGLTDVSAVIEKPDGSAIVTPSFLPGVVPGTYYYNIITQTSDPEGVYAPTVICPTEKSIDTIKIEMYKQVLDLQQLTNVTPLQVTFMDSELDLLLYQDYELKFQLFDSVLIVNIDSIDECGED